MKIVLNDNTGYKVKFIQRSKNENNTDLITISLDDVNDPNKLYLEVKDKFDIDENIGQIIVSQDNSSYTIKFTEVDRITMRSTDYENQVLINLK